jgi:outer membrane lipoprotein LolB
VLAATRWAATEADVLDADREQRYADLDACRARRWARRCRCRPARLAGRPTLAGAPSAAQADGFEQLGWSVDLAATAEGWIDRPPRVAAGHRAARALEKVGRAP